MKILSSSLIIISLVLLMTIICFGQKQSSITNIPDFDKQQIIINKQLELLQMRYQVKDIEIASVRVFVRYHMASTVWQNNDLNDSEAKDIAVEAYDDLQENKATIPDLYYRELNSSILALLESKSPDIAAKLQKKHKIETNQDEIEVANALLNKKDGANLAISQFQKSLRDGQELNPMTYFFLSRLQNEKSPMLPNVLSEIIAVEEKSNGSFSADTLLMLVHHFRDSSVQSNLWNRFISIIFKTTQKIAFTPDANANSAYNLLNAVIPDVELKNSPVIFAELSAVRSILGARVSKSLKEAENAYRRIKESENKLSETISQAESVESEQLKDELFNNAALLALDEKKFRLAIELIEKLSNLENEISQKWHDQFLQDIVIKALQEKDIDSALLASSKIIQRLSKAASQQKIGLYYFNLKNYVLANDAFEIASKLIAESEEGINKINAYFSLLSNYLLTNPERIQEIISPLTKSINLIPTPKVDEKPESDAYKKYVTSIMHLNWNFLLVMNKLANKNQIAAEDLAFRVNKREIRIVGDLAIWINKAKSKSKVKERKI